MSLSPQMSEVVELAVKGCENEMSSTDVEQLESLFRNDASLRQFYLELIELDLTMKWLVDSRSLDRALSTIETERAKPAKRRLIPPLRLPAVAFGRSMPVLAAILTVALLFYGTFTLISWNLRPDKLARVADGNNASVAMIRKATDVRWSKNASSKPAESSILSGEPLKIASGTMELELNAGTKLVIEGPADWSVDGRNSVSLRAGRLLARVPKQAIGFTVETPMARIVDLGTEFGVEIDASGATEVQVLKGKVKLHPGTTSGDSSLALPAVTLSAGMARRIEMTRGGAVVVQNIEAKPDRFTDGSKPQEIVVKRTFASSTFSSDRLHSENLIRGRGLSPSGRHTAQNQANAYWHTDMGHVQGEFVVFELPKQYALSFMAVWNYNQPDWCWRGIKEADIYVSDSGIGDPLKQPGQWRKVLTQQQFTIAPGSSEYDRPDIISLNKCKARFVAIVVDKIHGEGASAESACAGLSEVKFFGVPVP